MDNNKLINKQYNILESEEEYIKRLKDGSIRIWDIPKKVLTYDMCITAIKICGHWLNYVPEELKTEEMCVEAIKNNTMATRYLPDELKSKSFYNKLLKEIPNIFERIPNRFIDEKMIIKALKIDGINLKYVDDKKKTREICLIALNNNPMSLEYVPKQYKTKKRCMELLDKDYRVFMYIPEELKTKQMCIEILKRVLELEKSKNNKTDIMIGISRSIPNEFQSDKEIIMLERKIGARIFSQKRFDSEKKVFYVKEILLYLENIDENYEEKAFKNFEEFYKYVDNNLHNADLYEYDFNGIDLKKYNIDGAYINSNILEQQGLYNDKFYSDTLGKISDKLYKYNLDEKNIETELIRPENIIHEIIQQDSLNEEIRKMYYISDIHICHKLKKQFPIRATKQEIYRYIIKMVDKMVKTADEKSWRNCLLIGGDISTSYEISKMFYCILREKWHGNIIVILGNHEIWNLENEMDCDNLEEIINKYRQLFESLNITFLQNEVLFGQGDGFSYKLKKISEEEILNYSYEELRKLSMESRTIILGGLGFSGLNPIHNATLGLYDKTIKTIEDDKEQTAKFTKVYNKINEILGDDKVIIFTHTPKDNWSNDEYNSNWIYVSGHTHRNEYYCTNERTIYADNQIGYTNTSVGLKYFEIENKFDYFKHYRDGIYKITREEYLAFNRGINVLHIEFNVINGIIYMLKRNNIYCFLYRNKNGRLYLLKGGQRIKIKVQDVEYYYERMMYLTEIIKMVVKGYNNLLKQISKEIKAIGGDGTIHGCIVDIDFLNHIYVNPIDGKLSPYFAFSIVDKFFYRDLKTLLKERKEELYKNYTKLIKDKDENIKLLDGQVNEFSELIPVTYLSDTLMYSPSNQMKTIQYLTEMNVIRFWSDDIIDKYIKEKQKMCNNIKNENKNFLLS